METPNKIALIIEDIESNMKLLKAILELKGYSVLNASEGVVGWNSARKHCPDIILLDMQLPDVSGLTVARMLKGHETLKAIPIVAVTAFAQDTDQERVLNSGCDAYVSKPITVSSFMQTVETLVGSEKHLSN